ncbi:MAG: hypothetical protein ACT4ON_00070, partial [Bacteroidota bacterium]
NFQFVTIRINGNISKGITYYESGKINTVGLYEGVSKVKEWRSYYESGTLKDVGSFKVNIKNPPKCYKNDPNPKTGKWKYYSEQGELEYVVWYINGHTKKLKQFNKTGKLIQIYRFGRFRKYNHDSLSPYKADF